MSSFSNKPLVISIASAPTEQIKNSLCDLYGYSDTDFQGWGRQKILNYLDEKQYNELGEYLA